VESKNLYETKLGWYVSLETAVNDFGIALKSILWILLFGIFTTYIASSISVAIGLVKSHLTFDFLVSFAKIAFYSFTDSSAIPALKKGANILFEDMSRLFLYHSWIGAIGSYFFYRKVVEKSKEMEKTKYIKGSKLVSESDRLEDIKNKIAMGQLETNLELGRIPVPFKAETRHFLIYARTRGGKGVMASKIIPIIGADPLARAIIHDRKPEWVKTCYRPGRGDIIFNPLDERSVKWNIWNDISHIKDIKMVAATIVPPTQNDSQPYFRDSARDILESMLTVLWRDNECTNQAIRDMIHCPVDKLRERLIGTKAIQHIENASCMSTLITCMAWIDFAEDGDFSIRDWVKNGKGLLFVLNPEETEDLFRAVLTLFLNIASKAVLKLEDNEDNRIHLFFDELTSLGRIDAIVNLAKMGASKGAVLWIMFQDIQQINKIYGKEDGNSIMGNCSNFAVGPLNDPEAANYFADRIAKQEFMESEKTNSMGTTENKDGKSMNERRKEEHVVKPHDLLNLEEREFFVKIDGYQGVTKTFADIQNLEAIAENFILKNITKEDQIKLVMTSQKDEKRDEGVLGEEQIKHEIESFKNFF
jgi:type IV secretory pathway TraG/TraD family ATPase VirD4